MKISFKITFLSTSDPLLPPPRPQGTHGAVLPLGQNSRSDSVESTLIPARVRAVEA